MMETDAQTSKNTVSRDGDNVSTEIEVKDDAAQQRANSKSRKKNKPVGAKDAETSKKKAPNEGKMKDDTAKPGAMLESRKKGKSVNAKESNDYMRFRPFFKAIQEKDWKGVVEFVRQEHQAKQAFMTSTYEFSTHKETIFHIISRNLNVPVWVYKEFASMMKPQSPLFIDDGYGQSPLFTAALSGNIEAAEFFVREDKDLPNKRYKDGRGLLPIQKAAKWGHEKIIQFLWKHTAPESFESDRENRRGVNMLKDLINSGHYDIALQFLNKYKKLACGKKKDRVSILEMLATRPSAFESGSRDQLGYWERKIYEWIPVQEHIDTPHKSVPTDEENARKDESNNLEKKFIFFESIKRQTSNAFGASFQKLRIMLWKPLKLVPGIKCLHEKKLKHMYTLEIVKTMCHDVNWSYKEALESLWIPLKSATRFGICELVNEILKTNYYSYALRNHDKTEDILHLAILHRQEKVFDLIKKMKIFHWEWIVAPKRTERKEKEKTGQHADAAATKGKVDEQADADDAKGKTNQHASADVSKGKRTENFLHLAAKFRPSSQVSGAALQMQRELQWFKAVECFVHPSFQEQRNKDDKTPREVFTDEHKKLVEEGEKWMKDTAKSCTVVAALIITVVFAAAFTVPGGNNSDGFPLFLHETPFIIFIISDALALFSSAASVFMFLGILTSRYSEEDFLKPLPRKLIIGLITLFFSIASMMAAFIAVIYILLSDLPSVAFITVLLLGVLTVLLFAKLQFPLLSEMIKSTYGSILYPPTK